MFIIAAIILALLPLCWVLAAVSDLFTMTIPNRISAAILAAFFIFAPISGFPLGDIGMSLVASLIVFVVCFAFFAFNIMGGGDAKLLTASAAWFGFNPTLISFLVTVCFIGGLVTLFFLIVRAKSSLVIGLGIPLPDSLVTAKKIPYGIAIATGGLLMLDQSALYRLAIANF